MELNDFKFNKKFGQNFIFDKNLLNAIVKDANVNNSSQVLEIGAGAGTLTKTISENVKKVVSFEIDENLKPILAENLKECDNVEIVFLDALKTNIHEIEKHFTGNYSIIANLPYYITTPLIFKFLEETVNVQSITIMVQKEVAERLVAQSGCKDYGIITILVDFYGNAKITRVVSRKMFTPVPNVDSAVVHIEIQKDKYNCDSKLFTKIVQSAFNMRRKTILNNLSQSFNFSKDKTKNWLCLANIDLNARAEQLKTIDYVNLTNSYFDIISQ